MGRFGVMTLQAVLDFDCLPAEFVRHNNRDALFQFNKAGSAQPPQSAGQDHLRQFQLSTP